MRGHLVSLCCHDQKKEGAGGISMIEMPSHKEMSST